MEIESDKDGNLKIEISEKDAYGFTKNKGHKTKTVNMKNLGPFCKMKLKIVKGDTA